jgi:ribose 5-phosphate isomerase B
MKIIIGSDHRGFHKKLLLQEVKEHQGEPIEWLDAGCFTAERCDYPPIAEAVAQAVLEKRADVGVLLCGSGAGVSIVANRFPGIYAALVWNQTTARLSKEDDNANVIALPADFISSEEAVDILHAWLGAAFKGGRYAKRLLMIDAMNLG